ncbi:MAG: hypothetical protein GWN77_06630 [Gammaproteobacteria bacterium]|nr:hypothetical protein [Gammaproteobacteria bacterium]
MPPIDEQTAEQLIAELRENLARQEDAATAIAVYKQANWIISQLNEVKDAALSLAEQELQQRQLEHLRTSVGSAGWTKPQVKQLNQQKWQQALARDPELMEVQRDFDRAQAILQRAQEPFSEFPEPRFFIL